MTNFKKTLLGVAAAMALAAPAANAISIGGVTWTPSLQSSDANFGAQFNFTQWYVDASNATSSAENVAPNVMAAQIVPTQIGVGDVLTGVGEIYSINELGTNPASSGGGAAGEFCVGCELTFVFGGLTVTGFNAALNPQFSSPGWINIYVDSSPVSSYNPFFNYGAATDSVRQANVDKAADGDLWLSLNINDFSLTGTLTGGSANANLEITGGIASSVFSKNELVNWDLSGFTDALYNSSAFFGNGSKFSGLGNGQVLAKTIPEPASLALLGIGLLGLGGMSASRKRAKA